MRRLNDCRAWLPLGLLCCLLGFPPGGGAAPAPATALGQEPSLALAPVPASAPAPASAQQAAARELAALLSSFTALKAEFRQRTPGRDQEEQRGVLWLQRPDRFRIESGPPLSQTVVSDGANLWRHDRDLEQVVVSRLDAETAEAPALLLAGQAEALMQRFQVAGFGEGGGEGEGDGGTRTFVLRAKGEETVQELALVFVDGVPKAITLEARMQGPTLIEFAQVQLDPPLPPDAFRFAIPDGVDVIDARPPE